MPKKTFEQLHKYVSGSERIEQYSLSTLANLREWLDMCEAKIPKDATRPSFDIQIDYTSSYYDDRSYYLECSWSYYIPYSKEELEERALATRKRSQAAKEAAALKKLREEEAEKEQYERLKAKFEGK
jgi:hypothetical protein